MIPKCCNRCDVPLTSDNFNHSRFKKHDWICNKCRIIRDEPYRKSEKGKTAAKRYRQSKKGKISGRRACAKYYQTDKGKKAEKRYCKTEKGKCKKAKQDARRNRKMRFIKMFDNPFNESELTHWHHITDALVVALPKELHYQYLGKYHRENTMEIIKQIYGGR